jgi:mono/diheme cytochrome c family protein
MSIRSTIAGSIATLAITTAVTSGAEDGAAATRRGRLVYVDANCAGCHKWHGGGGGGYGGAALSLRATSLSGDALFELIACGRPGTRMPAHLRGAWDSVPCYAARRGDLDSAVVPPSGKVLDADDVRAVTNYVETALRGRGDPTLGECLAYWGESKRQVCATFEAAR